MRVRRAYYRNRRHVYATLDKKDNYAVESHRVPRWDGGYDQKNNKTFKASTWKPIWNFMQENYCSDIEGYITAQFSSCNTNTQYWTVPEPNQMRNATALAAYNSYKQETARSMPKSLITQCHIFENEQLDKRARMPGLPDLDYWKLVITDTTNDLTPLFRHCVVVAENLEVKLSLAPMALEQLLLDPINYQEHWKTILPPLFQQPVPQLLELDPFSVININ